VSLISSGGVTEQLRDPPDSRLENYATFFAAGRLFPVGAPEEE
jgi:hypothetical protein